MTSRRWSRCFINLGLYERGGERWSGSPVGREAVSNVHLKIKVFFLEGDTPNCPRKHDIIARRNGRNKMNNLKNLAGNDVSIFLFRFVLSGNGINFVLNKEIAADMYQDLDEKIKPLAHACCETLVRYKHLSVSDTIMDGNILDTGEFEVMLSKGLGRHFADDEKQLLFQDAKTIADLLITVMDRKTKELKDGKHQNSSHKRSKQSTKKIKKGLEELR